MSCPNSSNVVKQPAVESKNNIHVTKSIRYNCKKWTIAYLPNKDRASEQMLGQDTSLTATLPQTDGKCDRMILSSVALNVKRSAFFDGCCSCRPVSSMLPANIRSNHTDELLMIKMTSTLSSRSIRHHHQLHRVQNSLPPYTAISSSPS